MAASPVWPIAGDVLVQLVGGRCDFVGLAQERIDAVTVGDRPPAPGQLYVPVQEDGDGHAFVGLALGAGVSLALVSEAWPDRHALAPSLAARCVVVPDVLVAFRALAAALRAGFTFPVVAVAGSNGKTTTKELLASLLTSAGLHVTKTPHTMNGYTGIPFSLCSASHRRAEPPDVTVVEIGIDALGAMADHAALVRPTVGVITALGVEHLDGLESEARARDEELSLLPWCERRVLAWNDAQLRAAVTPAAGDVVVVLEAPEPLPDRGAASLLSYRRGRASPRATEVWLSWETPGCAPVEGVRVVPLGGPHNADNLALALGAALALELVPPAALLAPRPVAWSLPSMRCQVRAFGALTVVDDSYNASPASMRAAFALMQSPAWRHRHKRLVLGDMLELGDEAPEHHQALAASLPAGELVLLGGAMRALATLRGDAEWLPADAPTEKIIEALEPLADALVLVKGSRGVGLERVVAALALRESAPAEAPRVAVVGRDRHLAAALVTAALGREGSRAVVAFDAAALATSPRVSDAALYTGYELEPGVAKGSQRDELQLALLAQPFLHLDAAGVAVLDADDTTSALLAETVPRGSRVVTFGMSSGADVSGTLRGDTLVVELPGGASVSLSWPPSSAPPRLGVAAVAVAHARGEAVADAASAIEGASLDAIALP